MGERHLKAGAGMFVPNGHPYRFTAGPAGVELLEFRSGGGVKGAAGLKMEEKSLLLLSKLKVPNNLKIQASEDPIDSISTISSEYDLLILGAPEKDNWIRILLGTGRDKFTENSACSVLRLTTKNEK